MRTTRMKAMIAGVTIAAVSAAGLSTASPANAGLLSNLLKKKLEQQLDNNPNQIKNPLWLTQAASIDLAIPATLRLNKKTSSGWEGSSSKVKFDIGPTLGLGVKEATLYGSQKLKLRLGWPLGTVKMELPAQSGGNGTPGGSGLNAAPVSLFQNPNLNCGDYAPGTLDSPAVAPPGLDSQAAADAWFANGGANSYDRTAALSLAVRDTVNGKANIFTGDLEPFTLTTTMKFANVARQLSGPDRCRQAWTGATDATVSVNLDGEVHIKPGITKDWKLKLGEIELSTPAGQETQTVLPACLTPLKWYTVNGTSPTSMPTEACAADGSGIPAADGGNPAFDGTNGIGQVDVPAKASVSQLAGELLIG